MQLVWCSALVGCGTSTDKTPESPAPVTFHREVAPILFARCAACHHPEGAAPFSLLSYADARKRAGQITEITKSRFMPPWLPEDGHVELLGNRRLSDNEIQVLAEWAANGAVEGDQDDAPDLPEFAADWQLGEPDLILSSPPFELSADGSDRFRNFVLPVPAGADRWVKAVELRPENPQVTHHARLGIDANGESARRDAADSEPGYEGMAWGQDPGGQLITWTPGMNADAGTAGAAWQLNSDAKLVLHTHLQPSGKREQVKFRVGLHFIDAPPTIAPLMLRIGSRNIDIPPNESQFEVADSFELPIAVDAHFVFPHAHSLCREMLVTAHLPGGSATTLLAIRRFDENWHDTYRFAKPLRLPRGTHLVTKFTYDNSTANVRNPNHPPQRVVYGSNASDEMSDVYIQVTPVDPAQSAVLAEHLEQSELKSKIIGYRKSLELHPDDPWSIEALAAAYIANRQPQQVIELLEDRPALIEKSVQAKVVMGMAYLVQGDAAVAERCFRQALAKDDQFSLAWLGLGQAMVAKSQLPEAEQALRQAIELAPRMTVARLDLIDLLVASGRLEEAAALCDEAIKFAPDDYKPRLKLANVLAQQKQYDASLEQFAAARKLAPFLYTPEASLAIACYQNGDEPTAARLLQEATAHAPNDPAPHCFVGQIARRDNELQQARESLERAAELPTPSTWPESHRRQFLVLVYTEQLQLAQQLEDAGLARQALTAWLELDPSNAALHKLQKQLDQEERANTNHTRQ